MARRVSIHIDDGFIFESSICDDLHFSQIEKLAKGGASFDALLMSAFIMGLRAATYEIYNNPSEHFHAAANN